MRADGQPETSRTVDRALVLLQAVAELAPANSSELARHCGLNRTVVHRLLSTLEARGFVRRQTEGYGLGMALIELASQVEWDVRERARPVMKALSAQFGETVVLAVADGDEAVAVDQVLASRSPIRVQYSPGFRHPLAVGAHGRALLAFQPPPVVNRALQRAEDPAALEGELRQVRQRGWAASHDELQSGASGLAAPLFDLHGQAVASVGIVAPVGRFPEVEEAAAATLWAIREALPTTRGKGLDRNERKE